MNSESLNIKSMEDLKGWAKGEHIIIETPHPGVISLEFEAADESCRYIMTFSANALPLTVNGAQIRPMVRLNIGVKKAWPDAEANS